MPKCRWRVCALFVVFFLMFLATVIRQRLTPTRHTQAVVEISRPVTDCSGMTLELGDENIPTLGEVTFFARELGPIEMEEIMSAGYTLNAIAVGKRMFTPESTPFDVTTARNEESFANAQDERLSVSRNLAVEATLTRQAVSLTENSVNVVRDPPIIVSDTSPCIPIVAFGNDTSCHIMTLTEADAEFDTVLNYQYFPLIKPEYLPPGRGLKDRSFLGRKKANELLRYDPVAFPSWCGGSASFSIWISFEDTAGYVLTRYKTSETVWPAKIWKINTGPSDVRSECCVYVYVCSCVCVCMNVCVCMCLCMCLCMFVCMCANTRTLQYTHIHMFVCLYLHTHKNTHKHTHTHTHLDI